MTAAWQAVTRRRKLGCVGPGAAALVAFATGIPSSSVWFAAVEWDRNRTSFRWKRRIMDELRKMRAGLAKASRTKR